MKKKELIGEGLVRIGAMNMEQVKKANTLRNDLIPRLQGIFNAIQSLEL